MNKSQNLFLVGPMGAGKSAVGRQLARLMRMDFVDSDDEIEHRTGVDIPFIFEKEGVEGFRKREAKIIEELSVRQGIVLATGGGAVMDSRNRSYLGARGFVIYLHTTVEQQLDRTKRGRNRPLLDNKDRKAVIAELMEIRDPLYREISDLIVKTDGRLVREVAAEIRDTL